MKLTTVYFSFRNRIILFSLLIITLVMVAADSRPAHMQVGDDALRSLLSNAPAGRVHSFALMGERTLLATSRGLLAYDGASWQQLIEAETFSVAGEGTRLLAGTRAGVMVSDDGGVSWHLSNEGLSEGVLPLAIQFASGQNQRIYIGTDRHGVFRSNDGAKTWHAAGLGLPPSIGAAPFAAVKRLAVAPHNPDLLFAATDARGVYRSRDGGKHWRQAALELPGPFHHRVNAPFITFDEASPETVYLLVNFPIHSHLLEHTIHRSTDGGAHWTLVRKLAPNQLQPDCGFGNKRIAECGMRNANYQIPQSAIHNPQLYDFKVRDGVATIVASDGVNKIDLKIAAPPEAPQAIQPNAVLSGTDPDFDSEGVAVLHDDGTLYTFQQNDLTGFGALVARRFYQRHGDDYDIMITFADRFYVTSTAGLAFAYNAPIVNNILGIGLPIGAFNGGPATYGSEGRLRSFCNLNNISRYPADPNQSFLLTNSTLDIMGQEIGHTWGAYIHFDDAGFTSDELLGRDLEHWSFFFNSDASDLEGNQYQELGGGLFRIVAATSRYNSIDQYAMGTRSGTDPTYVITQPTSFTPPITVGSRPVDPTKPEARTLPPLAPPEFPAITVTGKRKDVTFSQIVKAEGARLPAPSADQGRVSMAFLFLVPPGREPNLEDLDKVKLIRKAWIDYFHAATGGTGTVDATLKLGGGSDLRPPKLTVTSPNGGELIPGGGTINITWDSSDENGIAKHDIALSLDGGATYSITIASKLNGKTNSFSYSLPPEIFTNQARIQITAVDYAGNKTVDTSDKVFTIQPETTPPTVKVDRPNGGEQIIGGKNFEIDWTSSDNGVIQSHDINLSRDGGKTYDLNIISGLPGRSQSFIWRVPADLKVDEARIEVVARDTAGNIGRDTSDQSFTIVPLDKTPPQVRLISPVGGEALQAGGSFTIAWTSSDNIQLASHDLALSTDGGRNFDVPIVSGLAATAQNFVWRVPDLELSSARVRITAIDAQNNSATDASASDLAITRRDVTPPIVKVLSPNGGEVVRAGEQLAISWQATDNVAVKSQRISLSLDGGKTFSTAVSGDLAPGISSFSFTIPDSIQSTEARIEVAATDTSGLTGRDSSDGNFTITAKDVQPPTVTVISPNGGEVVATTDQLRIVWKSSDNVGVVTQDVQLSTDGGATFATLQSGLAGNVEETLVDLHSMQSERAKVKIIARDAANNVGSDESDGLFAIALRPSISEATYNDNSKKLTIFASGVSASTSVEINGQAITGVPVKFKGRKGTLVLKADRAGLNLHTGENLIVVKERGLASVAFRLIL